MGGQCQPRRNTAARWSQLKCTHPSGESKWIKWEGCGNRLTSRQGPSSFTQGQDPAVGAESLGLVSVSPDSRVLAETNNGLGEAMGGQCQPRRNAAASWSQWNCTHPSC